MNRRRVVHGVFHRYLDSKVVTTPCPSQYAVEWPEQVKAGDILPFGAYTVELISAETTGEELVRFEVRELVQVKR